MHRCCCHGLYVRRLLSAMNAEGGLIDVCEIVVLITQYSSVYDWRVTSHNTMQNDTIRICKPRSM